MYSHDRDSFLKSNTYEFTTTVVNTMSLRRIASASCTSGLSDIQKV